jgi:iron complex outermembrane receptor protein
MPSLVSGNVDNKVIRRLRRRNRCSPLWADYIFRQGALDGLRLGGGVRYVGTAGSMRKQHEGAFLHPVDASIGYIRQGRLTVWMRLNANNLTNESYITSCASLNYCYMGEERT